MTRHRSQDGKAGRWSLASLALAAGLLAIALPLRLLPAAISDSPAFTACATALTAVAQSLPNVGSSLPNVGSSLPNVGPSLPNYADTLRATDKLLSPYRQYAEFWPLSALAGFVPWTIHARLSRRRRLAMAGPGPAEAIDEAAPDLPSDPLPPVATASLTGPAQAQGADLAARARFVAMNFAVPEAGPLLQGPAGWPLRLWCEPIRFTLTLRHAALRYRLEFFNSGTAALGPLIIRADLVAVGTSLPQDREYEIDPDPETMPLCHYLDSLPPAGSVALTGELRVPLASMTAMRLGTAEFLVPLMRLCVESAGDTGPDLSIFHCFAVGIAPVAATGGMQPFRLDLAPRIWRELAARRLVPAN